MIWDIFCRVIDNYGDIGVSWRLAADLAARGNTVRLWVDDASALRWMAPSAMEDQWPGVQVLPWMQSTNPDALVLLPLADVWVETFGCDIEPAFIAHYVQALAAGLAHAEGPLKPSTGQPVWINLEYLSAEPYVERSHGLHSPVMQGPAKGWTKTFFYPGFTAKTGGLLREPALMKQMQHETTDPQRGAFLEQLGISWHNTPAPALMVSLFCYEPPLLQDLLGQLAAYPTPVRLLVTTGRAATTVKALLGEQTTLGSLCIHFLNALSQQHFDQLLWHCDINFVRGEDSVVRAIWAGKPFVWHIYPQQDQAHALKLDAFLTQMQFSASIRSLHRAWNDLLPAPEQAALTLPRTHHALMQWQTEVLAARTRLLNLDDLATQLHQFVLKNR